jgi:hypothetical protein
MKKSLWLPPSCRSQAVQQQQGRENIATIRWGDSITQALTIAPGPTSEVPVRQLCNVSNAEPEAFSLFLGLVITHPTSGAVQAASRFAITLGVGSAVYTFSYLLYYSTAITAPTEDQFSFGVPLDYAGPLTGGSVTFPPFNLFKTLHIMPVRDLFVTPYVSAEGTGVWGITPTVLASPLYRGPRAGDTPEHMTKYMPPGFHPEPLAYR